MAFNLEAMAIKNAICWLFGSLVAPHQLAGRRCVWPHGGVFGTPGDPRAGAAWLGCPGSWERPAGSAGSEAGT